MDYLKIEDVAKKWGISPRRVQALCAGGKLPGAVRLGRDWLIPKDTRKPADGRTKAGRQQASRQPFPRSTPFLYMTDLYSTPGSAETSIQKLSDNYEAKTLLSAELSYAQGQIDKVYTGTSHMLEKRTGFYSTLSAGILISLCAIWRGDLEMWRRGKLHIAKAPAKNDVDRDIISFCITAVDSMLYNVENFPEWFKMGCFEVLHKDSLPAAKVYYAKYLYAVSYAVATKQTEVEGVQGLSLMSMIPNTIEPMISQAIADNCVIAELYLRMTCAAIYRNIGNDQQAIRHLDRAIALALPDKLYGILAEYCRLLDPLLEARLAPKDPEAWKQVKALYQVYNTGWSKLSGSVRGRNIVTTLTRKEWEVARLAAFGMQNAEIAAALHMSLSGVKQAIRIVSEKTGVSRSEFAANL